MRTLRLAIVLFYIGLQFNTVAAQTTQVNIKAPNFVRPLVERWIAEYEKTVQNVDINIVKGKAAEGGNAISFAVPDDDNGSGAVSVGRYAILPVTVKSSETELILAKKKLNTKRIKELFFVDNSFDEEKKQKETDKLHIYTGNSRLSAVHSFAKYFGKDAADLKGKKISGDDSFLNVAISKDSLGVTINPLSNIYDLQTRQPKSGLSIVSFDADKSVEKSFASLDELIELLERRTIDGVPVAKVGLSYDKDNLEASKFISWILTNGTKYVHQYGLLNLNDAELKADLAYVGRQLEMAQKKAVKK